MRNPTLNAKEASDLAWAFLERNGRNEWSGHEPSHNTSLARSTSFTHESRKSELEMLLAMRLMFISFLMPLLDINQTLHGREGKVRLLLTTSVADGNVRPILKC